VTKIRHRNYLIVLDQIFQPTPSGGIFGGIEPTLEPIPPRPMPPNVEDGHTGQGRWLQFFALAFVPISAHTKVCLGFHLAAP